MSMDDVSALSTAAPYSSLQADIVIPTDKIQDFFFMDDDEEMKEYGAQSAQPGFNMSSSILKDKGDKKVLLAFHLTSCASIEEQVQAD